MQHHATLTNNGGKFTLEKVGDGKLLRNGRPLVPGPVALEHMDRLVFGTSQYLVFVDPSKASDKDLKVSFESMQDEIGKASGIVPKDFKNMTQEEIQCQNELIDLLPAIEEANMISIALDKKVMFIALPVSSEARGDYNGKFRAYVLVKNFALGLEWIWTKQKFLERKVDMIEIYADFLDDGIVNRDKFKVVKFCFKAF